MSQAYGADFAELYDAMWGGFALETAPALHAFLARFAAPGRPGRVLDLCCGTGQLARYFLDHGLAVTGVDLSAGMLEHARRNAGPHLASGMATFVQADAADFELSDTFSFAVSTFDALNHLPDRAALRGCLRSVARLTEPGGHFVFDLNTRAGLLKRWNGTMASDDDGVFLVNRAHYDGGPRAELAITCFVPDAGRGGYRRIDEIVFNTIFPLDDVRQLAVETGWSDLYFARLDDLTRPVSEPELEDRVFAVATLGPAPNLA